MVAGFPYHREDADYYTHGLKRLQQAGIRLFENTGKNGRLPAKPRFDPTPKSLNGNDLRDHSASEFYANRKNPKFDGEPRKLKPRGRKTAIDVDVRAGDELSGLGGDQEQQRADQLLRLAVTLHRRAAHDVVGPLLVQEFAVLLGREEAGADGVDPHARSGPNSWATFRVRLSTPALEAE